jgi:heme exporter protein A
MIKITGLSKTFPEKVIKYPDIFADKGDFVLVCGESGTGKTTLCEMIAGFVKHDTGSIVINGREVRNVFEYIHYVSQLPEHNLIGSTCAEDLELWKVSNHSVGADIHVNPANQIFEGRHTGLPLQDIADTPVWKISFGQKKALAFCALTMVKREIWVIDEPLAGLDKERVEEVKGMFQGFINEGGIIIATSHTEAGFEGFKKKSVFHL